MAEVAETKFDTKKWLFSRFPRNGEEWGKWLDFGWKLLVCFLIGIFIYNMFFKKTGNTNTPDSHQRVVVLPGSTVNNVSQSSIQENTQKLEEKKREWWMPILYTSVYGEASGIGQDNTLGVGAQAGVRWDLN